ncbi:SurA N-terminal domain-containing protein [Spongiivirga sp. MCCC 1A20706]|uniref:peptidylprolyl isomerase n=1 Tax=Spongiivirga sp. MCCC 1A20706 TaxID=3160963 RepID=UPI0039778754
MAILGKIRSKGIFLILIIGLALLAFVFTGIIDQGGAGANNNLSAIGSVNGETINLDDFRAQVENLRRGRQNTSTTQVVNSVWDREVRKTLLEQQYEDLGISIEKDQIWSAIISNPQITSNPQWMNEDGVFEELKLKEYISRIQATAKDDPLAAQQYQAWINFEQSTADIAREQLYFNMIKAGVGATLSEGEFAYRMENDKLDMQYVQIPFTSIADSSVTVTRSEIQAYIDSHETTFKVDESRDVQYVLFEENPSKADEDAVKEKVSGLIENYKDISISADSIIGFRNTTDHEAFLGENSDIKFNDKFLFKTQMITEVADDVSKLAVGDIYGPYVYENSVIATKMVAKQQLADSVQSSHIIVPYIGAQRAPADALTKELARKKIDSIFPLVRRDRAKFTEVADSINADGSKGKGGDIGWTTYSTINDNTFDRDFSDFIFFNEKGDIKVVETKFGIHIIRIDDQKAFKEAYKIANLGLAVEPSEETISSVFNTTTKFELAAKKDGASFLEVAKENNYTARPVNKIGEFDENIPGVGNQRGMVQWLFEEDTKVGDIRRFDLASGYAVAQVTGSTSEGLSSVEDASARVLPILRKQKKAEIIKGKYAETDLSELAKAASTSVRTANAVSMQSPTISGAGSEPKVVGYAFGLGEGESSALIEGEKGMYMVKVTKLTEAPKLDNYSANANRLTTQQRNVVNLQVFNALKDAAEIEDNRAVFY